MSFLFSFRFARGGPRINQSLWSQTRHQYIYNVHLQYIVYSCFELLHLGNVTTGSWQPTVGLSCFLFSLLSWPRWHRSPMSPFRRDRYSRASTDRAVRINGETPSGSAGWRIGWLRGRYCPPRAPFEVAPHTHTRCGAAEARIFIFGLACGGKGWLVAERRVGRSCGKRVKGEHRAIRYGVRPCWPESVRNCPHIYTHLWPSTYHCCG